MLARARTSPHVGPFEPSFDKFWMETLFNPKEKPRGQDVLRLADHPREGLGIDIAAGGDEADRLALEPRRVRHDRGEPDGA